MKRKENKWQIARSICAALIYASFLAPASSLVRAQNNSQPAPAQEQTAAVQISPEQLDALVAPIALYPDPLLSQTLVASTYPLEIVQLQQWLEKNEDLSKPGNEKKLAEKVAKQPWDPSIQSMAALPDVVKWLAGDIQWTTDLGNAFLAQQSDVMNAIQRMRAKAIDKGSLASNDKQKVETQVVESKTVIVIEQADPQIVYVPSYDPVYAYGPIAYPYPPIYYPPYTGAAIASGIIGFGAGLAIGAAWGGGWGWGCGWGHNDINMNINNNFNRNFNNIQGGNRINNIQGGKWQHNPSHRGGAPYGDRGTANRYGGTARGDSLANRQSNAQRQLGQQGGLRNNNMGERVSTRDNAPRMNTGNRDAFGRQDARTGGLADRATPSNRMSGGGSDRIGSRDMKRSMGGLGGGSSSWGGASTRSSSSRGMSSMGGGRSFGGGGRRGGGRRG